MKKYEVALDDMDQDFILESVGFDSASHQQFFTYFFELLDPFERTKIHIFYNPLTFKSFVEHLLQ